MPRSRGPVYIDMPGHAEKKREIRGSTPRSDCGATWLVEVGGTVATAGDILFHYNRPYDDIYMKVGESFRRRGIGTYLVQELKRICYEGGSVPAARCNPKNIASRQTLQRAGFVPCGQILRGKVSLSA